MLQGSLDDTAKLSDAKNFYNAVKTTKDLLVYPFDHMGMGISVNPTAQLDEWAASPSAFVAKYPASDPPGDHSLTPQTWMAWVYSLYNVKWTGLTPIGVIELYLLHFLALVLLTWPILLVALASLYLILRDQVEFGVAMGIGMIFVLALVLFVVRYAPWALVG